MRLGTSRPMVKKYLMKALMQLAGTNDIAGNAGPTTLEAIEANMLSMIELAQAHRIRVVLASTAPAGKFYWSP